MIILRKLDVIGALSYSLTDVDDGLKLKLNLDPAVTDHLIWHLRPAAV
jgi:hypothetical protein